MPKENRSLQADLAPVVVALPTEDRQRSFDFYAEGLGLEPIGEAAEDGIPEPLQFVLNQGVRLMLVPTGGFRLVTGNRNVSRDSARSTSRGGSCPVRDPFPSLDQVHSIRLNRVACNDEVQTSRLST